MNKKNNNLNELPKIVRNYAFTKIKQNHKVAQKEVGRANQLRNTVKALSETADYQRNFQTAVKYLTGDFLSFFTYENKDDYENFLTEHNFDENFDLTSLKEYINFANTWQEILAKSDYEILFRAVDYDIINFLASSKKGLEDVREQEKQQAEYKEHLHKMEVEKEKTKTTIEETQTKNLGDEPTDDVVEFDPLKARH